MRRPLIAANWKMHSAPEGFDADESTFRANSAVDVVVFPTFLQIDLCAKAGLITGAQCGRPEKDGAFTGDVSMSMLKEVGCTYVLCGHSERRTHYRETNTYVEEQVIAALEEGLHPIVCIGETTQERERGQAKEVIMKQVGSIPHGEISIAYEPIWAIGSGESATPEQAEEMQEFIRNILPQDIREQTRILYGGSVNAFNAKDLLKQKNIDGLLIGSAALDPVVFGEIVEEAVSLM